MSENTVSSPVCVFDQKRRSIVRNGQDTEFSFGIHFGIQNEQLKMATIRISKITRDTKTIKWGTRFIFYGN